MNVKWEDVKQDYARKDAEIEALKLVLMNIMKHSEQVCPTGAEMSTVWNMAKDGLREPEA